MGHKLAIISDIHANYAALRAVLQEIDRLEPDAVICLGDIVGYGPDPLRCVDDVRARCLVSLCGNHDFAMVYGAEQFNPVARAALRFHRGALMPRPGDSEKARNRVHRWDYLKHLSHRHVRDEMLFVHGSPRNPIMEYLRKIDVLMGMEDKFAENFELVQWLCFIGHTHRPGVITPDMRFITPQDVDFVYAPRRGHKAIINVGSVGQPRDGDTRASFASIAPDGRIHFHRVQYDVEATARQVQATPGLHPTLAARLRQGK